jgi:DNA topoisomerase 2-associated protein PAT1
MSGEESPATLQYLLLTCQSNPHPFISLINPTKGQRLIPRLLRHLPPQQALTLLTLLIATYPQLDVVARPPPPPVADSSLLTKADRADRARREAETDCFLHMVIPGVDMLIGRCNLGLVAGLLGICAQRMDVARVAATRVSHCVTGVDRMRCS